MRAYCVTIHIIMNFSNYKLPYAPAENYSKKAAYFSMEFAVHQPLKIYSGGSVFLQAATCAAL